MTIKFPQYRYDVKVIVTDNITKNYLRIFGKTCKFKEESIGALHNDEGGTSYIFLRPDATTGIIAHESYHAIMAMFRYLGVEEYDEEIIAYNLEYLVSKIKLN